LWYLAVLLHQLWHLQRDLSGRCHNYQHGVGCLIYFGVTSLLKKELDDSQEGCEELASPNSQFIHGPLPMPTMETSLVLFLTSSSPLFIAERPACNFRPASTIRSIFSANFSAFFLPVRKFSSRILSLDRASSIRFLYSSLSLSESDCDVHQQFFICHGIITSFSKIIKSELAIKMHLITHYFLRIIFSSAPSCVTRSDKWRRYKCSFWKHLWGQAMGDRQCLEKSGYRL